MTKARTLADNFAADINGITAGTGITGGGTSGTVTVTNSMATAIDAKGDLVVGTGADTFSRLAVASTAGYLLSVDSAEATGLKWAAPASGSTYVGVKCGNASDFSIANNTEVLVAFTSESFDTDGFHDNSTNNSRITIPSGKGGYYQFYTTAAFSNNATGFRQLIFKKNGADVHYITNFGNASNRSAIFMSATINCSVGDYVQVFAYQDSGSTLDLGGGITRFYFGADYLGA